MYDYQREKPKLFTEDGLKTVLVVKRKIDYACEIAGCVARGKATDTGDQWLSMAAQDFLEEHGYVVIQRPLNCPMQYETIRLRGGS